MPWHDRGVLPANQVWAVTAYTMVLNGYDPGTDLNPENAAGFQMKPIEVAQPAVSPTVEIPIAVSPTAHASAAIFVPLVGDGNDQPAQSKNPVVGLIVAGGIGVFTVLFFVLRKRK